MPAVRTGGLGAGEKLVQISEMEDWAQLAFDGYKCACPSSSSSPSPSPTPLPGHHPHTGEGCRVEGMAVEAGVTLLPLGTRSTSVGSPPQRTAVGIRIDPAGFGSVGSGTSALRPKP